MSIRHFHLALLPAAGAPGTCPERKRSNNSRLKGWHEMRVLSLVFFSGMILWLCPITMAAPPDTIAQLTELEIRRDFESVLDLWRDSRYGELYERTYAAGRRSREAFIRRIAAAARRPACCWEKLQDARVITGQGNKAILHARVGLESNHGATEYCTRTFQLRKDGGSWKPAMADILSLAGKAAAKSSTYRSP
jgi:hypothetical protein